MIAFYEWMIMLSDLLLSGNPNKIAAAHTLIAARVFTRVNRGEL